MWHGEFRHPRLVEVYDAGFGWSREDDFFLSVVDETPRARVVDLGCGTGRLALGLAAAGHRVTGVDPARASLDAARAKPGADRVTWVEGTSQSLAEAAFDVAVMTSHVAQFLVDEQDWRGTLGDLRRCLVPGGRLVFDTRDPRARLWERWNPLDSRRAVTLRDGTVVEVWTDVTAVQDDTVSFTHHYVLPGGQELVSTATMRFRGEPDVRAAVSEAGLDVEHVYGGWNREPVGSGDGELLVLARRPIE
jgi:SAM-dependent methyltransferase